MATPTIKTKIGAVLKPNSNIKSYIGLTHTEGKKTIRMLRKHETLTRCCFKVRC